MSKRKIKIGIMDADLLERKNHRFPNLVCEKLSGYFKSELKAEVTLLLGYDSFSDYDEVYISKVFTDTPIPSWLIKYVDGEYPGAYYETDEPKWMTYKRQPKVFVGGTGFYFDEAEGLNDEIEHYMPDYHLYDDWINGEVEKAELQALKDGRTFNKSAFLVRYKEYLDYSIGFVTRGCFRKCGFCVNQKYDHVFKASPLEEFYDPERKKICLLDDNFLGFPCWKEVLQSIIDTKKPFKFKQGLDERLLTKEKCEMLFTSQYDGDLTFAFDNVSDYNLIHKQLKLIRDSNPNKGVMFYVLVGFDGTGARDIANAFKRIELLYNYKCLAYIMRYMNKDCAPWQDSSYRGMYIAMTRWCNQPALAKKMTFREFCTADQELHKNKDTYCASYRAMSEFEEKHPAIAERYFDIRFGEPNPRIK